jgi:hypothetical protein
MGMQNLNITISLTEDGVEAMADDLGVTGCGRTSEDAIRDLCLTLAALWEEFSNTPASRLSDDSLELFMNMRRCGIGKE